MSRAFDADKAAPGTQGQRDCAAAPFGCKSFHGESPLWCSSGSLLFMYPFVLKQQSQCKKFFTGNANKNNIKLLKRKH